MANDDQIKRVAWKGLSTFTDAADKRPFLTESHTHTEDVPDLDCVGLLTSPLRWQRILALLPEALRRTVERELSAPIAILNGASTVRELVLGSQFTRPEKVIIRDAYCAIVPGVIQVPSDEEKGGEASADT